MNGITFGQEIKKIRKKAGIPSQQLSKEVGKAVTYVSQLERGLIKKPDFETCYKLLQRLGFEDSKIEGILDYFGIMSPEHEEAYHEWASQHAEEAFNFDWVDLKVKKLKESKDGFCQVLNLFIEKDPSGAENLINNLRALTLDNTGFDFFRNLFKFDFSKLADEDKSDLIEAVNKFIDSRYANDEFGDFVRKDTIDDNTVKGE